MSSKNKIVMFILLGVCLILVGMYSQHYFAYAPTIGWFGGLLCLGMATFIALNHPSKSSDSYKGDHPMKILFKSVPFICPIVAVISLIMRMVYPQAIWLLGLAAFAYFILTLMQVIEFSTTHPHKYNSFQRMLSVLGCFVCLTSLAYIGLIYVH